MGIVLQTPYYEGALLIGALQIPAMPGMKLTCPKNYVVPPIIGNKFQCNVGKGARQPYVDVNLVVRDSATEAMGMTLLGYFMNRSADPTNNTNVISSGITFWNGRAGFILHGAKADSFTINSSWGEDLGMSVRFCGSTNGGNLDSDCLEPITSAPSMSTWDDTPELRFEACNFSGALADDVWRFGMSYSNNHRPDRSMHGCVFPKACNAGLPTAGFNMMVQEGAALPTDEGTIALVVTGTAFTRTFLLNRVKDQTPDEITVEVPESMRMHDYLCLGTDGASNPLTIS